MVKLKGNINILYLFILASLFGCISDSSIQMVSQEEMMMIVLSDTIQLIDVRSVEEFQEKHLQGAQNIVYDDDFEVNVLQLDPAKPVAVYCKTGRRSKECGKILEKNGFVKIYELKEGIEKWKFDDLMILDKEQQLKD